MPWKVTDAMDQKIELIKYWKNKQMTITERYKAAHAKHASPLRSQSGDSGNLSRMIIGISAATTGPPRVPADCHFELRVTRPRVTVILLHPMSKIPLKSELSGLQINDPD
jgi:hypothetical protein